MLWVKSEGRQWGGLWNCRNEQSRSCKYAERSRQMNGTTRNARCVGRMSLCLSHWGPSSWRITRNIESKRSLTPSSYGANVFSPVKWKGSFADHNCLDAVDGMSWIAPISFANSISVTLTSRHQGNSVSQSISLHSARKAFAAWCSTLLSRPPLSQANTQRLKKFCSD